MAHDTNDVMIRDPEPADEAGVLAAHRELAAEGFEFALGLDEEVSFAAWLQRVADHADGRNLPAGWVPSQFLLAVDGDGQVLGRVSIRLELTGWLREIGGHIGYGVRPESRRRGVATALLRHAVQVLATAGTDEVLVTCDPDNVGSRRTIERCGGIFQDISAAPDLPTKRRYTIATGGTQT